MAKIAGIKGQSPETYPPDNPGSSTFQTLSAVNPTAPVGNNAFTSLLAAPIEIDAVVGEKAIIMFSGVFENPFSGEAFPGSVTVTVAIFLDGTMIVVPVVKSFVLFQATSAPNSQVPYTLYCELGAFVTAGLHSIDIRAETLLAGQTVTSVNNSIVVIGTPV